MAFNLIKEAQMVTTLDKNQLAIAEDVKHILGRTYVYELNEMFDTSISKSDYNTWMKQIHLSAEEQSININSKSKFEDLAFAVIDDDPKMTLLGDNEKTKRAIINTLWHAHHASMGHDKVAKAAASAVKSKAKAEKEEEEMSMGRPSGYEDEEDGSSTSKHNSTSSAILTSVAKDGYEAGHKDAKRVKPNSTKNPYETGSSRHKLWKEAYKHGLVDGSTVKQVQKTDSRGSAEEDEEEKIDGGAKMNSIIDKCERDGFIACSKAFQGDNNFSSPENPYPAGSAKSAAWEHGWSRCNAQLTTAGE